MRKEQIENTGYFVSRHDHSADIPGLCRFDGEAYGARECSGRGNWPVYLGEENSLFAQLATAGLEPARPYGTGDFKSPARFRKRWKYRGFRRW